MIKVKAIANGYYGGKIRVPGEEFGVEEAKDFSVNWMASDDSKVVAFVRSQSKIKAPDGASDAKIEAAAVRAQPYKDWLADLGDDDDDDGEAKAPTTRRVNTGGTDGVVGADVPLTGAKLTAKERRGLASNAVGREITSTAEADKVLEGLTASTGSDNDDRSRDFATDATANPPAPAGDWEQPDGNTI